MIEIKGNLTEPLLIGSSELVLMLIIALIVPFALYLLRSIGVFMLSKRANLKTAWLAFLPGVWLYPFTMLVKEVKFFKSTLGKWAVVFAIITSLSVALSFLYNFLIYFPLVGNLLEGRMIYVALDQESVASFEAMGYSAYSMLSSVYVNLNTNAVNGAFVYPYQFIFIEKWLNLLSIVDEIVGLCVTIIEFVLFFNVFRKYWPQRFVMATILSVFGIFPIMVFIIRKKQPVNYFEFLRTRYQNAYGPHGQNPNPYNSQHGFYGQNPNANNQNPFQEFEPKSNQPYEEPFSDFNSNQNDKGDN